MNASSMTGVTLDLNVDIVYQLDPAFAAVMYQTVGKDYYMTRVNPLIDRAFKDILVNYSAEALYTGSRETVNNLIQNELREQLAPLGIILIRAPITNMEPPRSLKEAIEQRQVEEQNVLVAQQQLAQEEIEAERKRVEAAGIRDFQEIVSEGLTDNYLRWHYSETIKDMADSPNNTMFFLPLDALNLLGSL